MVSLQILLLFGYVSFVLTQVSTDDFLDEQLKKTKTEIAKLCFRDEQPVERKVYNVSWDKLWQQNFDKEQLFTVNAFNRILLIEGNRVLTLLFDTPPSNRTFSQQIMLAGTDSSTKFVKSIVWKNVLYLLICRTTGSCSLYTGTEAEAGTDNFQLRHRQSIQHKGYPMDASFFVRANRLYLVVADNSGKFTVPSLIYHWRGTYMDVVAEIMTTAAISVTTFRHKQSTIIVFAQNDKNMPNIGSMVYEFKEDSLDRIQFLDTLNPVAIYHYNHADFNFIFLTNERSPSNLFWWDGHELLNWVQIPEIKECDLFHDANIEDETFFLVGCNNTLRLYKFENASHPNLVTSIKLSHANRVIDVQIEIEKSTITMLVVIVNKNDIYVIQSWKLRVDEIPGDYSTKEYDMLSKHLAKLIEILQERKPIVDNYQSLWPSLLPVDKDLAITQPLMLPTLILDSGTIGNIDVSVTENVIVPSELEENIKNLTHDVNDILTRSKTLPTLNNRNLSDKNIVVDGDAFIESLRIDAMNVDFFNDFDTHSNDIIDSNETEESSLRGNNIIIENIEIKSLCGIPYQHWVLNNDTSRLAIDIAADKAVFSNDTVVLHSNISTKNFNAITLNNINLDEFFGELFIIDKNQKIKGKVKIARLQVTGKLTADSHFGLPEAQHQIYYNVTVNGNAKIATLDVDKHTTIFLNNEEFKLNNISKTLWTKSTDQTIENSVAFENNITVDRLQTKYLNGFTGDEFLYTNATTIPQTFKKLHFENVHVEDTVLTKQENNSIFQVAPESLSIQKKLSIKQLHTNQLFTEIYNDFLITDISNGKLSNFSRTTNFPTVRAKRVNAKELRFHFFNDTDSATFLRGANNSEKDGKTTFLKAPEFHVENLNVEKINDISMKIFTKNIQISDLKDLVIDDDLTVNGNIEIDRIDDQSAITYLRNMVKGDIVFTRKLTVDELTVRNATLESLHGYNSKDLFDGVFSKSREQVVPGNFSFYKIVTKNVESKFVNEKNTSESMWIDKPLFLTGNITFEDLIVEGDVATKTLNGRDVNELYNSPLNLPVSNIDTLEVDGNVSWISYSSLKRSPSLTFLLENGMTKSTDQAVLGEVVFENDASASRVEGTIKDIDEIRDIVEHTVQDDDDIIQVDSVKIFNKIVTIDNLLVTGGTNISIINNISIIEFNNSVAKKDESVTITKPISFRDEVTIDEVLVDDNVDNVPLEGLTLATDTLPRVTFKNLIVSEDVSLKNLDGVDFDKFMKNRITTDKDHEIFIDVQFNDIIEVTGNATVTQINGIDPSDLILNGMQETQLISGSKIFEEDVVVQGNINTKLINNMDISSEYKSGIQTDEDVEIIGDLVFTSTVNVPKNVYVSKLINGIYLHTVLADSEKIVEKTVQTFERNESARNEKIRESALISSSMGNIFSYIEEEDRLKIQVPNVKKVDIVYYEKTTKLNMFGEEPGSSCGLPDNCSCPTQYVAELTNDGCRIRKTNGTIIVRNYHESRNAFGVNVITNTIGNNRDCVRNKSEDEFITISWMKFQLIDTGDVLANTGESSPRIHGFIKDAKVFATHENAAFVVLAIDYDTLFATGRASSLIYKIDLEKNSLSLQQELHTDGASAIEIFQTNHHDVYLLVGCFGKSEKSFLYKLNTLTSEFTTVRTFGGKTRNAKSLRREEDHFILLDDYDTSAVNIFHYDSEYDNFYNYQSLFHDSPIEGIEIFYSGEHGESDSFVIVTTINDQFYIYKYTYAQKFQMKSHHRIDDLQSVSPFKYLGNSYVFVGTSGNSTILRIVQQGPR
nr:PREDICTED: uncharacterized protein LOC100881625 isoform X2 [Megachile rotundata]